MDWGWVLVGLVALMVFGVCWALVAASAGDREAAEDADLATRQRARTDEPRRLRSPWEEDDDAA